ncbi:TcfC E-set like domain-containing protein [Photobacterium damselae]|uniref:TcfC E-set like domain-containing protein n=1 Tax=Photobacterium damselae TaxID=38293 RepID=UPI001EDD7D72|nr:TcfC E-set like domain-containing protein [Photobacterium damselae]MCG3845835.1 TcfC E-set like domain-containing protein [Photobacterium damselae]
MNKYIIIFLAINSSIAYANDEPIASLVANKLIADNYSNLKTVNLLPSVKSNNDYNKLLNFSKKEIAVIIVGLEKDVEPLNISGQVSYYSIVITNTDKILNYLEKTGVKKEDALKIAKKLAAGISTSNKCVGERSSCIISNQNLEFVNDYYDNKLRIFIPSSYFKTALQKDRYLSDELTSNQWVSKFYGNYEHNSDSSYFVTSDNYIGFGSGYFNVDGLINQQDNDLKSAQYVLNYNKYSFLFGKNDNINSLSDIAQNSILSDQDFTGITFAKTDNLLIKDNKNRYIQFFIPAEGTLEVKKDNKVIFQKYVSAGKNRLFYSELPSGSYNVQLIVTKNKKVTYESNEFIYNLNYGDRSFSPYARVGKVTINEHKYNNIEAGFSYPIFDNFKFLLNGYLIDNDFYYTSGVSYLGNGFNSSVNYSSGSDEQQLKLNLNYGFIYFQLLKNHSGNDKRDNKLTSFNNLQINLSANYQLNPVTNIYSGVFYNEDENDNENYNLNFGLTHRLDNDISINSSYSIRNDDNLFNINVNIPLGDKFSYYGSFNTSNYDEFYSSLNYNDKIGNDSISITPSVTYTPNAKDKIIKSLNASLSRFNENYNSSVRIGSNNDDINYGLTFSTTQTLNKFGLNYTSENTLSSLYVDVPNTNNKVGYLNLIDSSNDYSREYNIKNGQVIYAQNYSHNKINYSIDNNQFLQGASIANRSSIDFLPGKMQTLSLDIVDSSSITVISTSNNTLCKGNACLKKNQIQSNVASFIVKPNQPFSIYADNKKCWTGKLSKNTKTAIVCGD